MAQPEQMMTRPRSQSCTFHGAPSSFSAPSTSTTQKKQKIPLSALKGSKSSQSTSRIYSGSFRDPVVRVYTASNNDIRIDENVHEIQALLERKLSRNATPNTSSVDLLASDDKTSD
jgi:hypothetical protein